MYAQLSWVNYNVIYSKFIDAVQYKQIISTISEKTDTLRNGSIVYVGGKDLILFCMIVYVIW
jgi:hypothetical protein